MRSSIDREIARLKESIRALKSRRNELSPISRLPAEILCNIFSLIEDNIFSSSGAQSLGQTLVEYHNIGDQQLSARRNSGPKYLLATLDAGYRKCW